MQVHQFVGAILTNQKGSILLQLRPENETYYPGYWTLPGGKVEVNETVEEALKREIKEELGIVLVNYRLFKKASERKNNSIVERHIYWSNADKKIEDLVLGEGSRLRYFSKEEIASLKIAFNLKGIIQSFLKKTAKKQDF